jgi:hypothetical protein
VTRFVARCAAVLEAATVGVTALVLAVIAFHLWGLREGFVVALLLRLREPFFPDPSARLEGVLAIGVIGCIVLSCHVVLGLVASRGLWRQARSGAYASVLLSTLFVLESVVFHVATGGIREVPSHELARICLALMLMAKPIWRSLH